MPVGCMVRLAAYAVKNDKVFAFSSDLAITKDQRVMVNLKEVNDLEFNKILSK